MRDGLAVSKAVLTNSLERFAGKLDVNFGWKIEEQVAPTLNVTFDTIGPALEWTAEALVTTTATVVPMVVSAKAYAKSAVESALAHPSVAPAVDSARTAFAPVGSAVDAQLGEGSSSMLVVALLATIAAVVCLPRRLRGRTGGAKGKASKGGKGKGGAGGSSGGASASSSNAKKKKVARMRMCKYCEVEVKTGTPPFIPPLAALPSSPPLVTRGRCV